jgi:type I restriction enzyme M protein
MGSLVETVSKIGFGQGAGEARDVLGRVYEYFIKEFARAEGHRGGEFFTPRPVARLLIEMLEPYEGRVLDPACGSSGLFVQSADFVEAHGGNPQQISIYGQERNQATWRIGQMNLAIYGLAGDVRYTEGGLLLDDAFPTLKADFVMANPPFNQSEWSTPAILEDARWLYGVPPTGNANYAWIHTRQRLSEEGHVRKTFPAWPSVVWTSRFETSSKTRTLLGAVPQRPNPEGNRALGVALHPRAGRTQTRPLRHVLGSGNSLTEARPLCVKIAV